MILDIPDMEVMAVLEALRLTPIYVYLYMPDSEEREKILGEGFKDHKFLGYEADHVETVRDSYNILLKAAQKAMEERGVDVTP